MIKKIYWPISKLPSLLVVRQLSTFLTKNNILDKFQSGFRCGNGTESALLRVENDLLLFADAGNHAALILLDLSAAFDTIYHSILQNRLTQFVGIQGTFLNGLSLTWSKDLLQLSLGIIFPLQHLLTVGSLKDPFWVQSCFHCTCSPWERFFFKYGIFYHLYADDTQIYVPLRPNSDDSGATLLKCQK